MKDEIIEIEVLNWEKFQHKNGSKTYSWFKMSANLTDDAEVSTLSDFQFCIWIRVLEACARQRGGRVKATLRQLRRSPEANLTLIKRALVQFEQFQWVRLKMGTKGVPQNRVEENRKKTTSTKPTKAPVDTSLQKIDSLPLIALASQSPLNPIGYYCDLWKKRNGKHPDIRPKEAGQISKLAKDVGLERACEIMRVYFSMPDPLFIKRGYDVGTMLLNITAINQFETNGKVVTKKVVEHIETQVDKQQGTHRKPRKSLEELEAERKAMMDDAYKSSRALVKA